MAEETFAARLREKAADTKIWSKHLPVIYISPNEADAIADALDALAAAADDGESIVHDEYDGTAGLADALEVYEKARAAIERLNTLP